MGRIPSRTYTEDDVDSHFRSSLQKNHGPEGYLEGYIDSEYHDFKDYLLHDSEADLGKFLNLHLFDSLSSDERLYAGTLQSELDEYRWILDEEENWDGEGIAKIQEPAFERAVRFIADHAAALSARLNFRLDAPRISPGAKGTLVAHWELEDRELVLRFPVQSKDPVAYYFRNDEGSDARGIVVPGPGQPNILCLLIRS